MVNNICSHDKNGSPFLNAQKAIKPIFGIKMIPFRSFLSVFVFVCCYCCFAFIFNSLLFILLLLFVVVVVVVVVSWIVPHSTALCCFVFKFITLTEDRKCHPVARSRTSPGSRDVMLTAFNTQLASINQINKCSPILVGNGAKIQT